MEKKDVYTLLFSLNGIKELEIKYKKYTDRIANFVLSQTLREPGGNLICPIGIEIQSMDVNKSMSFDSQNPMTFSFIVYFDSGIGDSDSYIFVEAIIPYEFLSSELVGSKYIHCLINN